MNFQKVFAVALLVFSLASTQAFAEDSDRPAGPPKGRGPKLTDAQKECLEGILGAPGEGERPSHEAMASAFSQCGIAKPSRSTSSTSSSSDSSSSASESSDAQ